MRRFAPIIMAALTLVMLIAFAQAQLPLTGGGRGKAGSSVCTVGTALLVPSDNNDVSAGSWFGSSVNRAKGDPDPSGGTGASDFASTADFPFIGRDDLGALSSATTYLFKIQMRAETAGGKWTIIHIGTLSTIADRITVQFDLGNGVVGSSNGAGTGSVVCTSIEPIGNSFYELRMAGQWSGGLSATTILIFGAAGLDDAKTGSGKTWLVYAAGT